MADATTSEGLSNLSAHLKEMNSDQAKGREWSNKMMQKGDTKQIMWARRTALGVERIQAMLKAWFQDMAKNNNKMMEAMLEAGRKKEGKDPKKSVLNKWNQVHAAKNVFVTDGSCMTSSSCVNPSITYMALTARAANYAISELKKRNL